MNRIIELNDHLFPGRVKFERLGDVARIRNGRDYKHLGEGTVPVYGSGGVMTTVDTPAYSKPSVLIPRKGSVDKLYYVDVPFWNVDTIFYTEVCEKLLPKFLYYFLATQHLENLNQAGGVPSLTQSVLNEIMIPVPPLDVQEKIVNFLDEFTTSSTDLGLAIEAEIAGRRAQRLVYRNELLRTNQDSLAIEEDRAPLADLVEFINGKPHERFVVPDGPVALLTARFISTGGASARTVDTGNVASPARRDDIALVMSDLPNGRALARCFYVECDDKYAANQRVCLLRVKDPASLSARYLFHFLDRNPQLLAFDNGKDQTHLKKGQILDVSVPILPLHVQEDIAAALDELDDVHSRLNLELNEELNARRSQYEYYRDRVLAFEEARA